MEPESNVNKSQVEIQWNPPIEKILASELPEQPHIVRVAAYCRVSTELDTQLDSIEIQKRHFMSLAHNTPNWQLVGIYTDQGISGTQRSKRKGFQRMVRHCEEGKIDKILCKSISRFGRNTTDVLDVIYSLKEQNISVIFEKEGIDTISIHSEFVLSTIAAIAQEESRSLSENITWSNKNRFQQGIFDFKRILGYNIENYADQKIITVNEEEAVIVREIFNLALHGMGNVAISRLMMEKGNKTAKGKSEWARHIVKGILNNERYTGDVLCQKTYTTDYLTHESKRNYGERQQYLIENHHSAIISHEVFNKVQIIVVNNKIGRTTKKNKRAFSGRIICGVCGATYHLYYSSSNPKWMCSRSIKSEELCGSVSISESQLETVMKNAFDLRYDISKKLIFHKIRTDIMRLHENDNFESRRINLNNNLAAALNLEKRTSGEEHDFAKAKYLEIEERIQQIERYWSFLEQDRGYRIKALEWLDKLPKNENNSAVFLQQLNIEYMRAWVVSIRVFSRSSYVIRWADDTEIKIEDCNDFELDKENCYQKRKVNLRKPKYIEDLVKRTDYFSQAIKVSSQTNARPQPSIWSMPALPDNFADQNEPHRRRVCAYCRVSTNLKTQLSSFELQIAHYTDYIQKNDSWKFCGIYADEGASGTTVKNRTQLIRMMEDCKAGRIDLIITKSISRFARNTVDCLNYVRMLKALPSPVGLYFEKENINTLDDNSEFLLTIFSSLAQDESRSLSESVRWGIQRRFEHGIFNFSIKSLLGYDTDKNGNWIINDEQAKTVRRIYREFLAGKTTQQIAQDLMTEGIKTGRGKTIWRKQGVYRILLNERNCGDVLLQKYTKADFMNPKVVLNKGHQTQYFIAGHHTAIVSKEDWNAAQIKLKHRSRSRTHENNVQYKQRAQTVFSNMFYCGSCGNNLVRKMETSINKEQKYRYHAWRCRAAEGRVLDVECHARRYREEAIEHAFMSMLLQMKQEKNSLIEEAKSAIEKATLDASELDKMRSLQQKMESLYRSISIAGVSAKNGQVPVDLSETILQLTQENGILQGEWEKLNTKLQNQLLIERNFKWLLQELNGLEEFDPAIDNIEFRKDIFERIVRRGFVFNAGSITYELNIGLNRIARGNDIDFRNIKK